MRCFPTTFDIFRMTANPVLVVGGGPVGLMQALYLACVRKLPVVLVEQQPAVGGLYASHRTRWGLVDQGVHIPCEVGHPGFDQLYRDILPPELWHRLEGVRKDIAGNIFVGHLNRGSLYPDLRALPQESYVRCLGEMFAKASTKRPHLGESADLEAYFTSRFGETCTKKVHAEIARKFWRQPLNNLSPWAAKIVHLSRVISHDSTTSLSLKQSEALDPVIGFPEQLRFPVKQLSNSQAALYPRSFGLSHVVEALKQALEKAKVRIITSTKMVGMEISSGIVRNVDLLDARNNQSERLAVQSVVWTSPLASLAGLLSIPVAAPPDPSISHRIVHLFLDRPPLTGELYWLWSYDPNDTLIRVSSPHAYCPDAANSGTYIICAEMHVTDDSITDIQAIQIAESQLRARELISTDTVIKGGEVLPGLRRFFVPTLANCEALELQWKEISDLKINNLVLATQNVNAGVFYMPDILRTSQPYLDHI